LQDNHLAENIKNSKGREKLVTQLSLQLV